MVFLDSFNDYSAITKINLNIDYFTLSPMLKTGGIKTTKTVQVKCRNCGKSAKAEDFVLDHVYKMMVCPDCIKTRKLNEKVHDELKAQKDQKLKEREEAKQEKEPKPVGWDKEDEYLKRVYERKAAEKSSVDIKKIDDEKAIYKCPKCRYDFKYNLVRKTPVRCPFCDYDLPKI